jgi:hypothetical protein
VLTPPIDRNLAEDPPKVVLQASLSPNCEMQISYHKQHLPQALTGGTFKAIPWRCMGVLLKVELTTEAGLFALYLRFS